MNFCNPFAGTVNRGSKSVKKRKIVRTDRQLYPAQSGSIVDGFPKPTEMRRIGPNPGPSGNNSIKKRAHKAIFRFRCPGCGCRFSRAFPFESISIHLARCLPKRSNLDMGSDSLAQCLSLAILTAMLPHQYKAVKFMRRCLSGSSWVRGCVLADGMGTGKTLSSIALLNSLARHESTLSALVVAPSSVLGHWETEFARWIPPHQATEVKCEA